MLSMAHYPANEAAEAIKEYRRWGDELPPAETLKDIFDPLDADNRGRLNTLLVKSHVCIDLARAEPQDAERWLASSEAALDDIEQVGTVFRARSEILPSAVSPYIARAILARTDLPNWHITLLEKEKPITDNYSDLLEKATAALSLVGPEVENDKQGMNAALIEAVPRILEARKGEDGYRGRFALFREESRISGVRRGHNPNWDIGICLNDDPKTFLRPSIKLALFAQPRNNTRSNDPGAYRAAGITPISAAHFGFKDPYTLILSCVEEAQHGGPLPLEVAGKKSLMTSGHLDHITDGLRQEFRRPTGQTRRRW